MKVKYYTIIINLILFFLLLFFQVPFLFSLTIFLWVNAFTYSINKIGKRSFLFIFLISFFVFLLGREFVEQIFGYKLESFDDNVNIHSWICLAISILSIWIGYLFFEKRNDIKDNISTDVKENSYISENSIILKLSLYLYFVSWVFAIVSRIVVGRYVSAFGYYDYYTGYSEYLAGNTFLYVISKIELIMPVALSFYMASMPTKKQFIIPGIMYAVYLGVSILSGQRSTFMLGVMFLFFYFLFRQETNPDEKWFNSRYLGVGIILLPVLAYLSVAFSYWRSGSEAEGLNIFNAFENFLYDQGVSLNAIKNAYRYSDRIPKQIYSLEFLHSGIFARLLGIKIYHGNTVDHALYGGSFTHSLGYVILGNAYLAGRGTGSSYIAELFYDFGYLGVFIGNIIYSAILANVNRIGSKNNTYTVALRFYIINQILWAPRSSFTGFIGSIFTPTTLATFLFIYILDVLLRKKHKKQSL